MSKFMGILLMLFVFIEARAEIGKVLVLKGQASLKAGKALSVGALINEGDHIITASKSFIQVELLDQTKISLGGESEFVFEKASMETKNRKLLFNFLKGKMRAMIKNKADEEESIDFTAKAVSLGVRGTEFMVSSLHGPHTDIQLLTGELEVDPSKLKSGMKKFTLNAGKSFNTEELLKKGLEAIKNIGPEMLQSLIDNPLKLAVSDSNSVVKKGTMAVAVKKLLEKQEPATQKEEEKKPEKKVGGPWQYDLKKEKWDIRDNVLNRKNYLKNNKCFYYFYKKLPGSGEFERFRRERDCDDYEFDL